MKIDSWSDDFVADNQVSSLKDLWERFEMERTSINDRMKAYKKKDQDPEDEKYTQVTEQLGFRETAIR